MARGSSTSGTTARGFALVAAMTSGCPSPEPYVCADADQCRDTGVLGRCEADGYCSFPDGTCESGWRYGEHSGARAGQCVPAVPEDTDGTTESPTSTATPTATTVPDPDDSSEAASTLGVDATTEADEGSTTSDGKGSSSVTGTPPELDLVLHLELEDPSFSVAIVDSGPHGLAVSCTACPSATPGRFGQGAWFDGLDACIEIPHDAVFEDTPGMTVSAWVRPSDATSTVNRMIVDKPLGELNNNSFELYFFDAVALDGQLQARFAVADEATAVTVSSPEPIAVGREWIHVAGTWDGAAAELWVGGSSVGTQPIAGIAIDDNAVLVGCDDDAGGEGHDNVFEGAVDDVRIYRETLSPEQIAALAAGMEP